jgi:hypothetical protein
MRTCKHVKANGEFCGSPALRGREYCYFHLTVLGRRLRTQKHIMKGENHYLQLPTLEDANSIQMALMQVMEALLRDQIDNKVAGLLLYGLQIASSNLQHGANFAQGQSATVAGSYDNFEQDYDLADTDCGLRVPEEEAEHEAKAGKEIDRCRSASKRTPAARAFSCDCVRKTKTMTHNLRRSRGRSREKQ